MKLQDRASVIARAQALRDTGMSAPDTARKIGISVTWVNHNTRSANTKYVSWQCRGTSIRPERREYVMKRCVLFFALALSRARERRLDVCS